MKLINGFSKPKTNFTRIPHEFIELLPDITSQAELKVILYLLRHTWGFSEFAKPKKITTDEFMNGRMRKDRVRMDRGTGLSAESVRDGLLRAEEHGFIKVEVDERDRGRIKKSYYLCMESDGIEADKFDEEADGCANEDELDGGKLGIRKEFVGISEVKSIHRTEKETLERNLGIPAGADSKPLVDKPARPDMAGVENSIYTGRPTTQADINADLVKASSGVIWRGRELLPTQYIAYADWWHGKTGLDMYGAKAKAKANSEWMSAFKAWYESDVTIEYLEMAYEKGSWKVISKPSQITSDAIALQAAGALEEVAKVTNNSPVANNGWGDIGV